MKKFYSSLFLSLLITGCNGKGATSSDEGSTDSIRYTHTEVTDRGTSEERNPVFEEKWEAFYRKEHDIGDTLVVGAISDADSLNPLTSNSRNAADIEELLFLGLTRTNPDFSPGPSLAKSWEFSEDHLALTFDLRDDVYWHDGVKTTAHDVKFTYELQKNPVIAWSAIKWKDYIEAVEVIDDYTVKFIFSRLYPYQLMDATVGPVVPKHLLEKVPTEEMQSADFNRHPVGNGPYRLKEWKAQQYVVLEANDKFYRSRPPLDKIIFKVVPDQENLVLQLKSGQVDFLESIPPRFYRDLVKQENLVSHVYPSRSYTYLGWNMKNPLFHSRKVRQALTMAINREEIIDALLFDFGEVCHGPISPIIWAHNPDVRKFPYELARSRKMLAEEGWEDRDGDGWLDKNGKSFEFELKTNKGNQIREDITVIVQDQLQKIGIRVQPNILEWTVLLEDLKKRNFEATVMGWSVGLKMDMTTIWHSTSINDKFNFVSFSNLDFDRLNDRAKFEMDQEQAKAMWYRAQDFIAEEQPYTFLYIPKQLNFVRKRFQNVQQETVGWAYNLSQWWVPKAEQKY